MKKIILTIFCFGMLFPLLGSAARPYGVEEIPNVQVGNRYRFTSNPDGVLSPSAVAEIDSLCYSLRHRALAQVAIGNDGARRIRDHLALVELKLTGHRLPPPSWKQSGP
jgi:hypothetical protein